MSLSEGRAVVSPGLLFRVRVLVGGRAALIEGLGESLCRLLGLELREPLVQARTFFVMVASESLRDL